MPFSLKASTRKTYGWPAFNEPIGELGEAVDQPALVELVAAQPVAHVVALGGGRHGPREACIARSHPRGGRLRRSRRLAVPATEDAQPADCERRAVRHRATDDADESEPARLVEHDEVVRQVGSTSAGVVQRGPRRAVGGRVHDVLAHLLGHVDRAEAQRGEGAPAQAPARELDLVVRQVHLHRAHRAHVAEVDHQRRRAIVGGRNPPGADVLVDRQLGAVPRARRARLRATAVGEQHPTGEALGPRVEPPIRDHHGIVGEALVAEQHTVVVEAGREQADAALEPVVHRDAHGRDVPPVAVPVRERAAVPGPGEEPAGLGRERAVRRVRERPERVVGGVVAVRIGVQLGSRRGVLQVVGAVVLGHPGAFDERIGSQHACQHARALLVVALARALPAVLRGIASEQLAALTARRHRRPVELHAVQRRAVRAAPVEVHPTVVVLEQVRVPERERSLDLLEVVRERVRRSVEGAGASPPRGAHDEVAGDLAYVGRVVGHGQARGRPVVPRDQVRGVPEARGHRREEVVPALEEDDRRIGRLPVHRALPRHDRLVPVAQVERVADRAFRELAHV